jgi:hypothetical protein
MTVDELIEANVAWQEAHLDDEPSWVYGESEGLPPLDELGPTHCPYCATEWLFDDGFIGYEPFGLTIHDAGPGTTPHIGWTGCCLDAQAEVGHDELDDEGNVITGFERFYGVTLEAALSYLTGEHVVEVSDALDWAIRRRLTIYDPTEVGPALEIEVKLWAGGKPASEAFWLPAEARTRYRDEEAELADWEPGSKVEVLVATSDDDGEEWVPVRLLHGVHYAAIGPDGWRDTLKERVIEHHARLKSLVGYKFGVACINGPIDTGQLVGVAIVGRPLATHTQTTQPGTLEVLRVATWGDLRQNASSKLYSACAERAKSLGYDRLITATHADESAASLRIAGWQVIGIRRRVETKGFASKKRKREAPKDPIGKTRWALGLNKTQRRAVRREASELQAEDDAYMTGLFADPVRSGPQLAVIKAWIDQPNRAGADWTDASAALRDYIVRHPEKPGDLAEWPDLAYMRVVAKLRGVSVDELKHIATTPYVPPLAPLTSAEIVDRQLAQEEELLAYDEAEAAAEEVTELAAVEGRLPQVFSYGGGLDSWAMLLDAIATGDKPDYVVHVDVGEPGVPGEWPSTERHMRDYVEPLCAEHGIEYRILTGEDYPVRPDKVTGRGAGSLFAWLEGDRGPDRPRKNIQIPMTDSKNRVCTIAAKVERFNSWLDDNFPDQEAEVWIGFEAGEESRMKGDPNLGPAKGRKHKPGQAIRINRYPLIERGLCRCRSERIAWASGYPVPRKSACVYCPYGSLIDWQTFAHELPEEFAQVVELEASKPPTGSDKKLSIMGYDGRKLSEAGYAALVAFNEDPDAEVAYGTITSLMGNKAGPKPRPLIERTPGGGYALTEAGREAMAGGPGYPIWDCPRVKTLSKSGYEALVALNSDPHSPVQKSTLKTILRCEFVEEVEGGHYMLTDAGHAALSDGPGIEIGYKAPPLPIWIQGEYTGGHMVCPICGADPRATKATGCTYLSEAEAVEPEPGLLDALYGVDRLPL